MNFSAKKEIFQSLRDGMEDEVIRCKVATGKKRTKTAPINAKLWGDLYTKLLIQLTTTATKEKWTPKQLLDCQLRLFYCSLVVNLESRNQVVAYDYMDFSRRIGEVWEDFCKICWDAPANAELKRIKPPSFATVKNKLLDEFSALVAAGRATNGKAIVEKYQQAVDLLGNINLTEDEYCVVGKKRFVIDFKSGFGSNEKGNTERLLTVAKIYGLVPEPHECVLVVRATEDEGNNYLQVLKTSGLWKVCCGSAAYEFIKELTGFDLAAWIGKNVAFHEDMETTAYQHLEQQSLTKYLGW
jgi:hypothetical protein